MVRSSNANYGLYIRISSPADEFQGIQTEVSFPALCTTENVHLTPPECDLK